MDESLSSSKSDFREEFNLIRRMFTAGESMKVEHFASFFGDEARYQFGNFPPAYGPRGIIDSSQDFLKKVQAINHRIQNMWQVSDGTVVCEMNVTYSRRDGQSYTLPCCDTIRIQDGKVQELCIYMDIEPVLES
jgi:predicted SnoaL-like aldol condensation-catalyzing enzyme